MATNPLPAVPQASDSRSTFSSKMYTFLTALAGDFQPAMNAQAATVDAQATAAAAAAATALAAANYKGAWPGLAGAANVPYSVSHLGAYWMLLQNLANVATQTPGSAPTYWQAIPAPARVANRVINGCMRIDQRNAGAAVTPTSGVVYTLDRWALNTSVSSKLTVQQVADAPVGAKYSLKATVAAQYSPGAADYFMLQQPIEGLNVIDFALGTASAITFATSFQVKSSVTGTFGVAVVNSATNRSYVGTYVIGSAGVWTPLVITISGDQTGTWLTDTGVGLYLKFDLGSGSNFNTSAGAWAAGHYSRTVAGVSFVNQVNGSTWQLAQVQLEPGAAANPFEQRNVGSELLQCQRYYQPVTLAGPIFAVKTGGQYIDCVFPAAIPLRATPTLVNPVALTWAAAGPAAGQVAAYNYATGTYTTITGALSSSITAGDPVAIGFRLQAATSFSGTDGTAMRVTFGTTGSLAFSAEL